jgi:hypothetical protein
VGQPRLSPEMRGIMSPETKKNHVSPLRRAFNIVACIVILYFVVTAFLSEMKKITSSAAVSSQTAPK